MPAILRWSLAALLCGASTARAAGEPAGSTELAEKLNNPISSLISVPLGQRLAMPFNLTLGRLFHLASQTINLSGGVRYTATAHQGEAQWGARLTMTLLFPE